YVGSQTVFDNTWHSVAFRFSHSHSDTFDIFVDGVKDPSPTKSTDSAMTSVFASSARIDMLDLFGTGGTQATTAIQRVRIYQGTYKTDADIAAMHALGRNP